MYNKLINKYKIIFMIDDNNKIILNNDINNSFFSIKKISSKLIPIKNLILLLYFFTVFLKKYKVYT